MTKGRVDFPWYENHLNWKMIVSCTRDITLYYLLFLLTVYATYQSVPLKISRIAPPRTFINSTFIEDFANGQLLLTQNKVAFSEISFVLYYAPWCAESRSARKIYEVVAKVYGTRVFFSSINCWQPGGECRNQYSNVPKWPTIMSYRSTGFGLQYNGILSEHALLNFVNSIMYPLKRITNLDDLFSLMNDNSVVVLALLDMKKNQKHFKEFYQTSLKYLEVDPHREIRFAICTGDNSKVFGSKHQPKLRIYLWNETLEYSNFNWKTAALLKYIKNSVHQNQKWISPNKKSNSIASNIVKSSLILLFTPRSYTTGTFSFNNMMSHIGHIYQNCLNDKWVKELILQQLTKFRENQYYNTMKLDTYCKDYKNIQLNSTFNVSRDDRLPERLLEQDRFYKCKAFDLNNKLYSYIIAGNLTKLEELSGLSCKTNKSSSTVVLDSLHYDIFARQLGIDINKNPLKTAVVILNDEDEMVYVMNETITLEYVIEFLKNYSYGTLQNHKRSVQGLPMQFNMAIQKDTTVESNIFLEEISSELLEQKLLKSKQTTILFMYSSQCNFCSLMSHYMLCISNTLKTLSNVKFLRVDGDKNDFNVNFRQEGFPLLIIYPENRKSDSVMFPPNMKVNKQNLISFILSNLPKSEKIQGIVLFCKSLKSVSFIRRCSNVLRYEVTDAIEGILKLWRDDDTSRSHLIQIIMLLKKVYLKLIDINPDDFDEIEENLSRISAWFNKKK